jgi:hypothetical protein
MNTLDQDRLDEILFVARALVESKDDVEGLLKVSFPLFFSTELDFQSSLKTMIEIYQKHYEREGAYTIPNEGTPLEKMEDFHSLDPEFRLFVLENLLGLEGIVRGDSSRFISAYQKKETEVRKLFEGKPQALFLRNWQRDFVRPSKKSFFLSTIPVGVFLLAIVYLILRGTGLI